MVSLFSIGYFVEYYHKLCKVHHAHQTCLPGAQRDEAQAGTRLQEASIVNYQIIIEFKLFYCVHSD